jgi:carboxypeptidase C (cathepsin A)
MLYLELPVGVGFSTSSNETSPVTDPVFVEEAVAALTAFYARFQKMKKNELYLTGHGYAAVFVTHFAKQILDQNADPFSIYNDKWNLKGILMGNPCVRADECYASGSYRSSKYHY